MIKLGSDHVEIEKKLVQIKNELPGLASADSKASLALRLRSSKAILALWAPHIQIEETSFNAAAIAGAMTFDEQLQLSEGDRKTSHRIMSVRLSSRFLLCCSTWNKRTGLLWLQGCQRKWLRCSFRENGKRNGLQCCRSF